mgnify:CR=1 FL=1
MESITLGQVSATLAFLVGLISSIKYIFSLFSKRIDKILNPLVKRIDDLELQSIKTDLTNFISDVEHNVPKSQIQRLNAHELYDRYTTLGGNSYIHEHWEQLLKKEKI